MEIVIECEFDHGSDITLLVNIIHASNFMKIRLRTGE